MHIKFKILNNNVYSCVALRKDCKLLKYRYPILFFVIKTFFYFFNIILFFSKYDFMIFAV